MLSQSLISLFGLLFIVKFILGDYVIKANNLNFLWIKVYLALWRINPGQDRHRISLDRITRSVYCKDWCITVNF